MIIQKAREALEKLRRMNYDKQTPDFGMDATTETLISVIANECKSTVIFKNGKKIERYESNIVRDKIDEIVRQLILNGPTIPKETMNKIIYSHGYRLGVNSDINLCKGIEETEDGSLRRTLTIENIIIDNRNLKPEAFAEIQDLIHKRFARQIILQNLRKFPRLNPIEIFKEILLHIKEKRDFISREYMRILRTHNAECGENIMENTVNYYLEYMESKKFKAEVLNSIIKEESLVPSVSNGKYISFDSVLRVVTEKVSNFTNDIPDINSISRDISQIYSDIEAQLIAYSTDITKLSPEQIEKKIKDINYTSLRNSDIVKDLDQNGYRAHVVVMDRSKIELLNKESVARAMKKLSQDIYELVQNRDKFSKEEYLKRAIALKYRFIRIHPFPDSNGRTSRALLNMITISKGLLINFPKASRRVYGKALNATNQVMDKQQYIKAIKEGNPNLVDMETSTNLPLYDFISQNIVISEKNDGAKTRQKPIGIPYSIERLDNGK